ncbi:hypothetical protein [Curtobacterium sp. MCBD17_030]|nr:hypothetical protein [Curtobacterium sp. MCBD17_030]
MRILHPPVPATSHVGVDVAPPVLQTLLLPVVAAASSHFGGHS